MSGTVSPTKRLEVTIFYVCQKLDGQRMLPAEILDIQEAPQQQKVCKRHEGT